MKSKKIRKIWIAECYPTSDMYDEEAGKTVGRAIVGSAAEMTKVIQNRRLVQGRLTPQGKDAVLKAMELLQPLFGPNVKLSAKFDRHCGCSMCPCSPGMKIFAEFSTEHTDSYFGKSKEDYRAQIHLSDDVNDPIYCVRFRNQGMISDIQRISVQNDLLSNGDKSFYMETSLYKKRTKAYENLQKYSKKRNK